jgi:hypothetical protein
MSITAVIQQMKLSLMLVFRSRYKLCSRSCVLVVPLKRIGSHLARLLQQKLEIPMQSSELDQV